MRASVWNSRGAVNRPSDKSVARPPARPAGCGYHQRMTPGNAPSPPSGVELLQDEPLARHTYLRIGGPARYFATPADTNQLERLALWASDAGLPLLVIGGGSNLLVADGGVSALVVSLRRACGGMAFEETLVTAGAAVMLPALARAAAERDLGGLEFAIGIPGSVGGALQTNAGIGDGRCIAPLVRSVEVLTTEQPAASVRRTLAAEQIRFDYRSSSLRGSGHTVLSATLDLLERPGEEIRASMRRLLGARGASQPTADPNAGSIFRNPPDDYAGRLVDTAGCKGLAAGAASVSELHANFIVHNGGGTATDVATLMAKVQRRVFERFGVWLEPEIEWWGDGPTPEAFSGPRTR